MKNPGNPEIITQSAAVSPDDVQAPPDPIKAEIRSAFSDSRAFFFFIERNVIRSLQAGASIESFREVFTNIKNIM